MKKIILSAIALMVVTATMAQNRPMYLHMKSGEVKEFEYNEVDYIDFGEEVTYDLEFEATSTYCAYFGGNDYSLSLSDAPMSDNGFPTQAGQNLVRLYIVAPESANSNDARLEGGRYALSPDYALGNIYNSSSYTFLFQNIEMQDGSPYGWTIEMESGALNIEYDAAGNANLVFRGKMHDYGEGYESLPKNVKVTFKGNINYDNQDPSSYQTLTQDVTMVPTGLSGGYSNSPGYYGNYSLTYYNVTLDDEGYITSAGELLNFEILTPESATMDIANQLPGDYTITDAMNGPWAAGNFLDGQLYPGYNFPMGTYYTVYGEGGSETRVKGFVKDGTVHVDVADGNVTMTANLIAEGGHTITMNYTAPESSIVPRNYAPGHTKANSSLRGAFPTIKKSVQQHNVIKFIKK